MILIRQFLYNKDFPTISRIRFHVVIDKVVKFNKEKDHIVIRGLNLTNNNVGVIIMMNFGS